MSLPKNAMALEAKYLVEQQIISEELPKVLDEEHDLCSWALKEFFKINTDKRYNEWMILDHISRYIPEMREENFKTLIDFIQAKKTVKKLTLVAPLFSVKPEKSSDYKWVCPKRMETIAVAISSMPNLTHLELGDYYLTRVCYKKCRSFLSGPCYVDILTRNLKNCVNLVYLDLSRMPHGISKLKHLVSFADMIKNCQSLSTLDLRYTYMGDMKESRFQILENAILQNKSITSVLIEETYGDPKKAEGYRERLKIKLQSRLNVTFVSGFHPRLGAGSAMRSMYESPIFDRKLITLVFQFSGTGNTAFVEGAQIPLTTGQEVEESHQAEETLNAFHAAHL